MVCESISLVAGEPYSYKLLHSEVKSMEKLVFTLKGYGSVEDYSQTVIGFKTLYQLMLMTEFFIISLVVCINNGDSLSGSTQQSSPPQSRYSSLKQASFPYSSK